MLSSSSIGLTYLVKQFISTLKTSNKKNMKDYKEYMNSLAWKNKRDETFSSKGFNCQRCNSNRNLHIHHATYDRFTEENVETDLFVLCMYCHDVYHQELSSKFKRTTIEDTKHFIESKIPTPLEENRWDKLQEEIKQNSENRATSMLESTTKTKNIQSRPTYVYIIPKITKKQQKKAEKARKERNLRNAKKSYFNK